MAEGSNPWQNCIDRVKVYPRQKPKPFTITDLQTIIGKFANHPQYSHYKEFVIFLASTACRFGEAAGLRWKHLGVDYSTAWIGESIGRGHQKGTKTAKARTIQLSQSVQMMLLARYQRINPQQEDLVQRQRLILGYISLKELTGKQFQKWPTLIFSLDDALVFPSPKGLPIDDHNFNRRAWRTILASCHLEYRSPYKLRHSAISHALHNGANPIALAEQTGHTKRVLLSTYAHAIGRDCLFVNVGNLQTNKD